MRLAVTPIRLFARYRTGLVVPALAAFGVAAGTALAWQARVRRVAVAAEAPAR